VADAAMSAAMPFAFEAPSDESSSLVELTMELVEEP
jgi:hypothetical protein